MVFCSKERIFFRNFDGPFQSINALQENRKKTFILLKNIYYFFHFHGRHSIRNQVMNPVHAVLRLRRQCIEAEHMFKIMQLSFLNSTVSFLYRFICIKQK